MKPKTLFLVSAIAALMLSMTSCNKEIDKENHPEGPIDERLIGTWEFDHIGDITQWDYHDYWKIYANGNCYKYTKDGYIHYYWTVTENTLILDFKGTKIRMPYLIMDELLTFDIDMPDNQKTWYRKYEVVPD